MKKNVKLKFLEKILKSYIKMEKTIVIFGNIEIEKQKFHQHKKQISIQKNIY